MPCTSDTGYPLPAIPAIERRVYGGALRSPRAMELIARTYEEGPIGISIRSWDGVMLDCNQRYLDMRGLNFEQAAAISLGEMLHPEDRNEVLLLNEQVRNGDEERVQMEVRIRGTSGGWRWVRACSVKLADPGTDDAYLLTSIEDVTEIHTQRMALEHAAMHDPLTGVANRKAMRLRIERSFEQHDCLPNLLILDIDRFKLINDSLGHAVGDAMIQAVAGRICQAVRTLDLVARLGGDEFAVVIPPIDPKDLANLAERLRRSMEDPVMIDGREIPVTISIGVAPGEGCGDIAELLVRADRAMYAAKAGGRNRCVIFDETLRDESLAAVQMERELRRAIDHGEIEVHFQPEFTLHDRRVVGAEALLRWRHPTRGLLTAGVFIETAEQTGMIDELGRFALREACRRFAEIAHDPRGRGLKLRVNISAREFGRPELPDLVRSALASAGVEPHCLCLEMTEMTLMEKPDQVLDTLARLHEIGVTFAIDDFGTGYSSMVYLKRFPVDSLKIDRSFVSDLEWNADSMAIVNSIIALGNSMSLDVIAEGIETEQQAQILRGLGCERGQGYLVSPAVPIGEFAGFLDR